MPELFPAALIMKARSPAITDYICWLKSLQPAARNEVFMTYDEAAAKLEKQPSYDLAIKVIYGWVKQDKVTPDVMQQLVVSMHKKFVY